MLEARALTKRYRTGDDELTVLDGVSLTVDAGEIVALRGPSGSGKTTLLKLIAGVLEPDAGEVRFNGSNIAQFDRRGGDVYRLRMLGFVLQRPRLVGALTASENAALRLMSCQKSRTEAQRLVAPLLDRLDMTDAADRPARALSEGQRQRVAIAAALSTEPALVIADEPTGSLDGEAGARVLSLLTEICDEQRVAILVATHDPRVAEIAHRSLELRDAQIDESSGVRAG